MELVFGVRGEAVMNAASVMQRTRCTFQGEGAMQVQVSPRAQQKSTPFATIAADAESESFRHLMQSQWFPGCVRGAESFANVFSELVSVALGYKRSCIERYLMMVNLLHRPVAHLRPSTPRAPPASSYHTSRDSTAPHNTDTPTPSAPNGPALGF
jgi:hypothetical protein